MLFKHKKYFFIGLLSFVILLFAISYITFYLTKSYFPNPGLRNQNYTKPYLAEIYKEKIDKEVESYFVSFKNENENIYATITGDINGEIKIIGYNEDKEIECGVMNKNEAGLFEYKFCFDYFNINSLSIKFDNKYLINELVVYYIR